MAQTRSPGRENVSEGEPDGGVTRMLERNKRVCRKRADVTRKCVRTRCVTVCMCGPDRNTRAGGGVKRESNIDDCAVLRARSLY